MDRKEERRRLHDAVDNILDGPDPNDVDGWVRHTLVGIGLVIRASHRALDYEIGRVISGTDRRPGFFPENNSWAGAAIGVDPHQAEEWITAGRVALGETPPPSATQQRALAALLRPISSIALHAWLMELAKALDALRFGEVRGVVSPLASRLHGYKEGRTIWIVRMRALEWVEFQYHARQMSKTAAISEVATAFGISEDSVKEWKANVKEKFGEAVLHENLEWSRAMGRRYRSIQEQLATGKLEKFIVARDVEYLDRQFGREHLNAIAMTYKGRRRRRDKKETTRRRGETDRS